MVIMLNPQAISHLLVICVETGHTAIRAYYNREILLETTIYCEVCGEIHHLQ